ncbi:mesenteric estrogen-dependent adipogenesis protein-like [Polyodon spathula]|uniref:mesenteric estrogen-dependent adipogenesis protein-like n=1 Tax=Polyodon spathula TaxID=7913 RepID=UPI001B7E3921|nr:mesenteric estrogen-dependent adipogenesis protein-like [Polyodon spathula]
MSFKGNRSGVSRTVSSGIVSISSGELHTLTTCNCEIAVLPVELLFELQIPYFQKNDNTITVHNQLGGYSVFCDGKVEAGTETYTIRNYIERSNQLKGHADYKDYRETLLTSPIVLFTKARKTNQESPRDKTFAVIVNTRHPNIRAEIEKGMNSAITSVWGESYSLQFDFQRAIKQFFSTVNYDTDGEGLSISFEFKADALFDISYMFGFSKRKAEVNGRVLNLFSANEEKRKKVKMFLDKISEPYIRRSSMPDRKMSLFSMGSIDEEVFNSVPCNMGPRTSLLESTHPAIAEESTS